MKIKLITAEFAIFLLIFLFVYTTVSKLLDFQGFKDAMSAQPLSKGFQRMLIYLLPISEFATAVLLTYFRTRLIGLYTGLVLLLLFTGYIILIKLNFYGNIPCTCSGVIKHMTWTQHLLFNLFFLMISTLAAFFLREQKRFSINLKQYSLSPKQ
jgi:putative oxidoreductase